jgi:ubiquinone/menaquinone biosynthesis C-methylase UbiE
MPLFRRRDAGPPSGAAVPSKGSAAGRHPDADELEWRSYDSVAATYARVADAITGLPAPDLIELLQVEPGARVLDVGTGTGATARAAAAAAKPGGLTVGVDPSMAMLVGGANKGGGPHYAAAVAIDLPFRDGTFTHVTMAFVLAHFERYETALFDILRVLRSGGRVGVLTWGPDEDNDEFRTAWREVLQEFAEPDVLSDAMHQVVPWEDRFADRDQLKQTLHDAGLRDIWIERRQYRTELSAEDYLDAAAAGAAGRFLHAMLGEELWGSFQRRAREIFAERFPPRFNDFRDVLLTVGHKP